jgi:MFS transporter, DHA1 family, multidrug resistance protein
VRDTFEGDRMARIMSLVMATFILVPVFAPLLGSAILEVAPWQALLWVQVSAGVALMVWATRLHETLAPEARRSVSPRSLLAATGAVVRNRQTLVFGLAVTAIFGVMTSYLGTSEVVIDEVFGEPELFPVVFGLLAGVMALGSLVGARLVVRLGLDGLVRAGATYLVVMAAALALLLVVTDGEPPLWAFYLMIALLLPSLTALMPTCNAAAMAPLGQVAGMGAAILGAATTAGGALLGTLTDAAYDGTVVPLVRHMLVYLAVVGIALLVMARPPREAGDEEAAIHEPVAIS